MSVSVMLSAADHARISEAVAQAELGTSGEIVTITADVSDSYGDVALWWSAGAVMVTLALITARPDVVLHLLAILSRGWITELSLAESFELSFATAVISFVVVRLLLLSKHVRLALTPGIIKAQRVRRRALSCFKMCADARTTGRTGILIYVSLSEHKAEIVADRAIHEKVDDSLWGDAMADMIAEIRNGRLADGVIAAVRDVGAILATHLPRAADDANELPDRLIEL